MNEQEQNEKICELLLGWKLRGDGRWFTGAALDYPCTPTFDDWHGAGLILEAAAKLGQEPSVMYEADAGWIASLTTFTERDDRLPTGPLAIRSAALAYLETLR